MPLVKSQDDFKVLTSEYLKLFTPQAIIFLVQDNFSNVHKIKEEITDNTSVSEVIYKLTQDEWLSHFYLAKVLHNLSSYQYFNNVSQRDISYQLYGLKHLLNTYFLTAITFNINTHALNLKVKSIGIDNYKTSDILLGIEIITEAIEDKELWLDTKDYRKFIKSPKIDTFITGTNIDAYEDICAWIAQKIAVEYKVDIDSLFKYYIKCVNEQATDRSLDIDSLLHANPGEIALFNARTITKNGLIIK